MAFDEDGKQVPEYQGHGRNAIPKLRRDFPDLIIEGKDWDTDFRALPLWIDFYGMDWGG